jgi:hypothetical protein
VMRYEIVSKYTLKVFGEQLPHCRRVVACVQHRPGRSPALNSLVSELRPLLDEGLEDFALDLWDGKGGESSPPLMDCTFCGADSALNLSANEGGESFLDRTFCATAFALDVWEGKGGAPSPVFMNGLFCGADFVLDLCDGEGGRSSPFGTFCGADFTLLRVGCCSNTDTRADIVLTSGDCSCSSTSLLATGDISAVSVLQRFPIARYKGLVEAQADGP